MSEWVVPVSRLDSGAARWKLQRVTLVLANPILAMSCDKHYKEDRPSIKQFLWYALAVRCGADI